MTDLAAKIPAIEKGNANGVATLDAGGKVPLTQIPDSIIGQVTYMGTWNASTNNPALANPPASTTQGDYYVVSVAGTQFSISFNVGDWIISNGTAWEKVDNTDAVASVFGRLGVVTAASGDYTATQITYTATGNVAATNVQSAIDELDSEKLTKAANLADLVSPSTARDNLQLGTMSVQNSNTVAITGGNIAGITDLAVSDGGTGASTLTGYIKGNGTLAFTASGTIPNTDITGLGNMSIQNANTVAITGGNRTGITDLLVADGGTGASTLTGYVKGSGTAALTASSTIPNTDITGLGTMSTQNSNSVSITGGSITGITDLAVADGGTGVSTSTGTTNVVLSDGPTIVTPVIATINDANGNETLKLASIASAVNEVTIENAATGNAVHILATGGDASIGLHLAGKGASGYVNVQDSVDATKRIMFNAAGGTTNTRTMLSSTQTVDRTISLPDATDTLVGMAKPDTLTNKTLTSPTLTTPILGTPASGNLANCTFPTLNQSTTGSAATLTTPRAIYGNNFDGSAALTQVIASTYGGTGNGFAKFSGPATSEKTFTLPNASSTLLYDGGALGTPASGTVTNLTGTASININGTVGASTANTGAFTTLSASGVASFAAGTNLAPAISFSADSNTGFFNVAADTIGITTAGVYAGNFQTNSAGGGLYIQAGGTNQNIRLVPTGTGSVIVDIGGTITSTSSTGLAVNGALSATGTVTVGSGTSVGLTGINIANGASNYSFYTASDNTKQFLAGIDHTLSFGKMGMLSSHDLAIVTGNATRILVDTTGNVGIGTSSPASKLQVTTSGAAALPPTSGTTPSTGELIRLRTSSDAAGGIGTIGLSTNQMWLQACDATSLGAYYQLLLNPNGGDVGIGQSSPGAKLDVSGNIRLSGANPNIEFNNGGGMIYGPAANTIAFASGGGPSTPVERARIDSSGNLLVGTTSALNNNIGLSVQGAQTGGGSGVITGYNSSSSGADGSPVLVLLKAMTTTSSSARFVQFYADAAGAATPMGAIVGNGSGNVQFATISDAREKTNIQSIAGSLDKVLALKPVSFDWISNSEHTPAGFIAQDVKEVFPEFVVANMANEGSEQRYGLTGGLNNGVTAHLVKALQELNANLVAQVAALSKRISALESSN